MTINMAIDARATVSIRSTESGITLKSLNQKRERSIKTLEAARHFADDRLGSIGHGIEIEADARAPAARVAAGSSSLIVALIKGMALYHRVGASRSDVISIAPTSRRPS